MSEEKQNSLSGFVQSVYGNQNMGTPLSQTDTFRIVNRYELLFYDRQLLSQLYVEHGIVQTLIEQPVLDALRGGIEVITSELDADDMSKFYSFIEKESILKRIGQVAIWGRLFGGGGLVINVDQDPENPFRINDVKEDTPLEFYSADLWELNLRHLTDNPTVKLDDDHPYMFYGKRLHKSRVIKFKNKEAPSFIRPRLRGWGLPEVERLVRSMNKYFKNNDVIFELIDEAKVDVYKIKNLNSSLLSGAATEKIKDRVMLGNMLKNYLNALVMDVDDEYDQKKMAFGGLSELQKDIRQDIACDVKMPMTKLFGMSSAGFNSGEDDIENYNAMIESEVRDKLLYMIRMVCEIVMQKLFGYVPEDMIIKYKPLRILTSEQEEVVKNHQFSRTLQAFQSGLIDAIQAKEAINSKNLLPIQVEVTDEVYEDHIGSGDTTGNIE